MKIVCITGLIGSGKDSVASHIKEKYGFHVIDYASMLRAICRNEGLEVTRDNLQNLRVKYGNTFLAEAVIKEMKNSSHKKIVLTPMRRSEDFIIPKKEFPEAKMILVESPDTQRFERLSARNRENDPKTIEEFRRQEAREWEIFNFDKTFSMADFKIVNDSSMEDLYAKIDKIMLEI